MSTVLWHVTMSLDGFIAQRDNSTQWMFAHGSVEEAVATAKAAADGKDVGVFGADIARQCINAGLVDEIFVHLVPVLLGDGLRLFSDTASPPVTLRKTRCDEAGQITNLRFEVLPC